MVKGYYNEKIKQYFFISSVLVHCVLLLSLIYGAKFVVSTGIPLPVFAEKTKQNLDVNYPSIARFASPILDYVSKWQQKTVYAFELDPFTWQGIGANAGKPVLENNSPIYIDSTNSLIKALKSVQAGQVLELLPGEYIIEQPRLHLTNAGESNAPIRVTSKKLGDVVIKLRGEGFVVDKPFWQFENLHLIGSCTNHSSCEHAFHVVGEGNNASFINNIFQDFNAAIKINGINNDYPDDGVVVSNTFFNTSPRKTTNPVTPIDLMHADNWVVSENLIFDFIKAQGNKISYGAFYKGGSKNGTFSHNVIMCNANLRADSIAIGLSLGGGGSPDNLHRANNTFEHDKGVISHNIIMNCANDVGIYLNKASNALIENNILYNSMGIDVRFSESSVILNNNVMSGRVNVRDNALLSNNIKKTNVILSRAWLTAAEPLDALFYAPSNGDFTWVDFQPLNVQAEYSRESSALTTDFCGNSINEPYLGAYSGSQFCKQKMNLENPQRKFRFSEHNEN